MKYILKYQRYPVMEIDLTLTPHGINFNRIIKIIDRPLLPFALQNVQISDMLQEFKRWYIQRLMPSNRIGVEPAIKSMSLTKENNIKDLDWKGTIMLMSLLAYGRNMTDKYWLSPTRNIVINTGMPTHGLNGIMLKSKLTYKGLDFHKNGIAEDYGYVILKNDGMPKSSMDFNCPDFCTNGKEKKRFVKDPAGFFWLEKYVSTNLEEFKNKARKMTLAYNEQPDIFQGFQFVFDENTIPIGYKTRCLTSKDVELVTLKDICLNVDYKDKTITKDRMIENLQSYISEKSAKDFIEIISEYIEPEKIPDNSGVLINTTSKSIIQKVAWM